MQSKKKKKEFNDLLILIIITIAILPFITRLVMYSCGFSEYPWFPDVDIVSDFFSYYKSYVFLLISIAAVIILTILFFLYRTSIKNMRAFLPLSVYLFFTVLSAILSVHKQSSFIGGYAHFESVFILIGYVVISVYTYQIVKTEDDVKTVMKALTVSVVIMCVIGFFQMIGMDLLRLEFMQKLIIPRSYWEEYLGNVQNQLRTNAVSLTLFNPNYASVYISMLLPLFIVFLLSKKDKREKAFYIALNSFMVVILFKTYSRTGLVSLLFSCLILGYFFRNRLKYIWKQILITILGCLCIFILIDSQSNFRFLTKITSTFDSFNKTASGNTLEEIQTLPDKIYFRVSGKELYASLSSKPGTDKPICFYNKDGEDLTNQYNADINTLEVAPFDKMLLYEEFSDNGEYLVAKINKITWRFYFDKEQGYLYLNEFGKPVKLTDIAKAGFENHENIASGRGYIWSRTIPLLKNYLLIGSGPDTFPIIFPQSDYVGKANNCKTPYTLIEKPHSLYLMIAVQTGSISLIAFLCFYIGYLIKSFRIYRNLFKEQKPGSYNYIEFIGLGSMIATISYMISGIFNDSSLQTSPIFWAILGLGMMANDKISRTEKEDIQHANKKR